MSEKLAKSNSFVIDANKDLTPDPKRMKGGQVSLFSLSTLNGVINEQIKKELKDPNNKKLYKQMLNDVSIAAPYTLMLWMVLRPEWKASFPKNATAEEKNRASMISWMMKSTKRDFSEYITEAMTYPVYGFWTGEKIYDSIKTPYGTFKGIVDIKTISQDTISRWHFDRDSGDYIGLRQDLSRITHNALGKLTGKVDIPRVKYLHLRNNPKRDNPEGESLLNAIYVIWKYKSLLEEYLTIGVIKDMSGIPVFGIAAEKLAEARADTESDAAKMVSQLEQMAQAMHSGDLNHMVVPIAYNKDGKELYNFKLLGVEGGGKQYNTLDIIKYYNQQILIRFFSDVLSLGSDGSGSYALSDNKITLIELSCQHHLNTIKRMLNHDLMRQIYTRNGWEYDPDTSCYFDYDKSYDGNIAELAKAVQQMFSVGAVRATKEIESALLDRVFDLPPVGDDTEFLDTVNTSGASEGMTSGLPNGVGESTTKGGDRNTANLAKMLKSIEEMINALQSE